MIKKFTLDKSCLQKLVKQIIDCLEKTANIYEIKNYLRFPDNARYLISSVRRCNNIWNTLTKFYLALVEFNDPKLFEYSMWIFNVASHNKSYITSIDLNNPMSSDLNFHSKIRDTALRRHLYQLLEQNTPHSNIIVQYERLLKNGFTDVIVLQNILNQKIDIPFGIAEGCAQYLPYEYFERAFFRASFTKDLDEGSGANIFISICVTLINSNQKFDFFMDYISKTGIVININSKMFDIFHEFIQNDPLDCMNLFIRFMKNMTVLTQYTSRFLSGENVVSIMNIISGIGNAKLGIEKELIKFVTNQISLRAANNQSEIVCGINLIKAYHKCGYQKFIFPIKMEISMTDFEELCALKINIKLLRHSYNCLKVKEPPTEKCMEHVTKLKSCDNIITFLVENGCKISMKCIDNLINQYKSDTIDDFKYVYREFVKSQQIETKLINDLANDLANDLINSSIDQSQTAIQ